MPLRCLFVLLAGAVACRSTAASGTGEAPSEIARWSEPRRLADASGRPLALWGPSLATFDDTLVLVGTALRGESMAVPGSLGGHNLAMHARPLAMDSLYGLYVRLAISPRNGVRHLLWGEPGMPDSVSWLAPPRSLWHASVTPDGEWSQPARILGGVEVQWAPATSSPPVFGSDGTLHAAVAVWTSATGNQVVHLALDSAAWRITPVHRGTATYTAVGIADNGHLAVSWIAQAREPGGPPNAAHAAFSVDQGRSWSAPMRLDTGTSEVSGQLRLVGLQDSFLALWGRYGAATFTLESIQRAVIRASSSTVARLPSIDPPYLIYGPEVVRDPCGDVHLVVRHVTATGTHADYAPPTGGGDQLQHVDSTALVHEIDVAAARGMLALAWVGRTASGQFVSQVRTRPTLCGR